MQVPLIGARRQRWSPFWGRAPGFLCATNQAVPFHAFTDETKERRYIMVAALLAPSQLSAARSAMRSLILPRQCRIHLHKESDTRRKQILDWPSITCSLRRSACSVHRMPSLGHGRVAVTGESESRKSSTMSGWSDRRKRETRPAHRQGGAASDLVQQVDDGIDDA
ncbi:hypothetical protein K1W54_20420 [Micromonospora sp. CPCC 205371]|nr:hypothetical protein [Micromonospora sp. CPCC 205371]